MWWPSMLQEVGVKGRNYRHLAISSVKCENLVVKYVRELSFVCVCIFKRASLFSYFVVFVVVVAQIQCVIKFGRLFTVDSIKERKKVALHAMLSSLLKSSTFLVERVNGVWSYQTHFPFPYSFPFPFQDVAVTLCSSTINISSRLHSHSTLTLIRMVLTLIVHICMHIKIVWLSSVLRAQMCDTISSSSSSLLFLSRSLVCVF